MVILSVNFEPVYINPKYLIAVKQVAFNVGNNTITLAFQLVEEIEILVNLNVEQVANLWKELDK